MTESNTIVSLPHNFTLYSKSDKSKLLANIPPTKPAARLTERNQTAEEAGVAIDETFGTSFEYAFPPIYTGVENLPSVTACFGKYLIVSALVGEYVKKNGIKTGAIQVLSPDSSPAAGVRDDKGAVIGTTRVIVWAGPN